MNLQTGAFWFEKGQVTVNLRALRDNELAFRPVRCIIFGKAWKERENGWFRSRLFPESQTCKLEHEVIEV